MAIVVIGGAGRGVGKTAVTCDLLHSLNDYAWWAVKVSTHASFLANATPSAVRIAEDGEASNAVNAKDTSRYLAAGAQRAFFVEAGAAAWPELAARLQQFAVDAPNLIVESTHAVAHLAPTAAIAVVDPSRGAEKSSLERLVARFDAYACVKDGDLPAHWPVKLRFPTHGPDFHNENLIMWCRAKLTI